MKRYLLGKSTKLIDVVDRLVHINNGKMSIRFPVFLQSFVT
jgi:hypothetical protein